MIVYPAIDLKGGRVVQLIGGRPDRERLSLADPAEVARRFVEAGFSALHVVDLDAALDDGANDGDVRTLIAGAGVPVQVGGGIRDTDAIERWLTAGAARVIVGTRAVTDGRWLEAASAAYPDRLLVAADVRGDVVVSHGWTHDTGIEVDAFLGSVSALPIAGLLITDVDREGSLAGIDAERFSRLAAGSRKPVIAAGGIGGIEDLRLLRRAGVAGAVVGTALYTGAIDPAAAAEEYSS